MDAATTKNNTKLHTLSLHDALPILVWADLTRWKVINKTLDLPFENPQETYSTSEHLYTDLGIAPGTKGRIKDPEPQAPRSDSGRGGQRSGDRGGRDRKSTRLNSSH